MPPLAASSNAEINDAISRAKIHVVSGSNSILKLQPVLNELSARCGQLGVMDDVGYFLKKPGILRRVPHLLVVSKASTLNLEKLTADDLLGAALLYKYKVLGCGIGTYTTNDRSGRGTLVAPAGLRSTLAEIVSRMLMGDGALAVLISFRDGDEGVGNSQRSSVSVANDKTTRWAWRERETADYLLLENTFEETLAKIGQRTRRNMRYYRKRAESELGCQFVPSVQIGRREFLQFNRDCMYAVSPKIASWRYDSLKDIGTPLFMGIKDRDGRWLSLLGGRRHHATTEILWQMNRGGLSVYSLSLVMRAYFMEHEISHGMTRLYMEGGTAHPMRFSFVNDKVTDLVAMRRSWPALLVRRLAKHLVKRDNELAVMLLDQSLYGDTLVKNSTLHSPEEETN
jgi:hypothetical protein